MTSVGEKRALEVESGETATSHKRLCIPTVDKRVERILTRNHILIPMSPEARKRAELEMCEIYKMRAF
jgi:hypothetical protein